MGENGMYRILVCDDERDIVSALRIYLTAEGYEVLEAYNGSEMLRLAATQEVHLILLDVMMPGMDGLSAMAELRRTSNVPVILLTAKSEDTDKVLGLNLGADDYVTKPFNPIEVMARVRSQLRRYLQLGGGQVLPTQVTIGGIMGAIVRVTEESIVIETSEDRVRMELAKWAVQTNASAPQPEKAKKKEAIEEPKEEEAAPEESAEETKD